MQIESDADADTMLAGLCSIVLLYPCKGTRLLAIQGE